MGSPSRSIEFDTCARILSLVPGEVGVNRTCGAGGGVLIRILVMAVSYKPSVSVTLTVILWLPAESWL